MPKRKAVLPQARVVSSRVVYRGPVFQVISDQVVEPGGPPQRVRRDVVRHPGSVVVAALHQAPGGAARLLLERQYRHAAGDFLWELPAGRIEPGERPVAAAQRELLEETGYRARSWQKILEFFASPGFLDERMLLYLARHLQRGEAQPEPDEHIRIRFFPLERAVRMARHGLIRDAKTLAALFWLNRAGGL